MKNKYLKLAFTIFIYLLGLSAIYPPIYAVPNINIYVTFTTFITFIFAFFIDPLYFLKPKVWVFTTILLFMYVINISYINNSIQTAHQYIEYFQIPLFYICYEIIKKKYGNKHNILIIKLLFPFFVITSLVTISALLNNPLVSRAARKEDPSFDFTSGIGGYEFIYFLVFINLIILHNILNRKYFFLNKITSIIVLIIFSMNVLLSNYATATAMLLLSYFIILIYRLTINYGKTSFLFLMVFSIFCITLIAPIVLNIILENFGITTTTSRFSEVLDFFNGFDKGAAISERDMVYQISIDRIIQNPFLGLTFDFSYGVGSGERIGRHSFFLDSFALFGVLFGLIFIYVFFYPIIIRFSRKGVKYNIIPVIIAALLAINFVFNTATISIAFGLFFIFPTFFENILNTKPC